jgi:uncharacterized integral membrane protein
VTDLPESKDAQLEQQRRRRRRLARALGLLVVAVIAVWFVVDNSQPVKVRFWFVTSHPRLIWVVIVCIVGGALFGYLLGRERRRRRAHRRGFLRRGRDGA